MVFNTQIETHDYVQALHKEADKQRIVKQVKVKMSLRQSSSQALKNKKGLAWQT